MSGDEEIDLRVSGFHLMKDRLHLVNLVPHVGLGCQVAPNFTVKRRAILTFSDLLSGELRVEKDHARVDVIAEDLQEILVGVRVLEHERRP